MKKALALILSLMMILSVCSVSAAWVSSPSNATGVYFSDDFEAYAKEGEVTLAASTLINYGGPYASGAGTRIETTPDGDRAYQCIGGTIWWQNKLDGKVQVDSDILTYSMTVNGRDGYLGDASTADGYYPGFYFRVTNGADNANNTYVQIVNTGEKLAFVNNGSTNVSTDAVTASTPSVDLGEDHTLTIEANFNESKTYVKLDGNVIYTHNNVRVLEVNSWVGLVMLGKSSTTNFPADANGATPAVYVKEWSIERSKDYANISSSELDAPVVLESADFSSEDDALKFVLAADGVTPKYWYTSTIADGVLTLSNGAYPTFNLPGNNLTDVYELSYDVYGQGGRLVVYDYTKGSGTCSANLGCYKPGSGLVAGQSANWNANITADDNSKWYTVKVEWCGAPGNTYMYYRVYDRETGDLMGKYEGNYGQWTDGNAGAAVTPMAMQAPMFWNDGMTVCQLDNIVFSKLPVGYEYTTYYPQVWVNNALASTVDAIAEGDMIECQSYGPVGGTQLLVGFNADGEIIATKVMNDVIRDRYRTSFNATAEDFAGAASIRLFFFEGFGGAGFKPITTASYYSIVE